MTTADWTAAGVIMRRVHHIHVALAELDTYGKYMLQAYPNVLGSGAYGFVVEANNLYGSRLAIKHVPGFLLSRNVEEAKRILRELRINMLLRDEPNHIIRLVDAMGLSSDGSLLMVYEMGMCDLHKITKTCPDSDSYPFDLVGLAFDVSSALSTVHARGVLHRDLKLSNLIFTEDHRVALADFGISGPKASQGQDQEEPVIMTSYVQTRAQRAPELLYARMEGELQRISATSNDALLKRFGTARAYCVDRLGAGFARISQSTSYGESIDIWSFGCILAELIIRAPPFEGMHNFAVLQKIVYLRCEKNHTCRLRGLLADKLSDEMLEDRDALVELVLWMLSIDPEKRPSARQVLEYLELKWPEKMNLHRSVLAPDDHVDRFDISHLISHPKMPQTMSYLLGAMSFECKFFYYYGQPIMGRHS